MRVKGAAVPKPAAMSLEPMGFLQLMAQPGAPSMPYSLLQPAFREAPAPAAAAAAAAAPGDKARPARKRKQAAFLEDSIPLDAVLGRNVKAKAGEEKSNPKAAPRPAARKPPAAKAAARKAPAAGKGAAPKGGRAPAASKPAAKAAAKAAREPRKPPVAPTPRRPSTPAGGQKQQSPAAASAAALAMQRPPPMAYRMVGPAVQRWDAAGAPLPPPAAVPPTTLALPTQIVSLAAFIAEEERRQNSAASDGRVVLRVLPGGQLPPRGSGSKTVMRGSGRPVPSGRPAPLARPSRGRASREGSAPAETERATEEEEEEEEEDAGPAAAEARPSAKGRAGKGGRGAAAGGRATPDPPALPPGHWRPGMSMAGGINCVDAVESLAAPPHPPTAVGLPPHWRPAAGRQAEPEVFSEDPIRGAVDFVRFVGRSMGRLAPGTAGTAAEQRAYRERLSRIHASRDGRHIQGARGGGTRRSARARTAPEVFMPATVPRGRRPSAAKEELSPEEATDTRLGVEYQCALPALRGLPRTLPPPEARWLDGAVSLPEAAGAATRTASELQALAEGPEEGRAAWLDASRAAAAARLPPAAATALGLEGMGAGYASWFAEEDEAALHSGLAAYGRDFHAISQDYVPALSPAALAGYYYNVLKLRATPRAVAWYEARAAEAAAAEAEAEAAEAERAAEAARRVERQEVSNRRRMLREVIAWVKASAKCPAETNMNKPVVRERALRVAKLVGSMAAPPQA